MKAETVQPADNTSAPPATPRVRRVGCVSFLNARPLIDGLDEKPDLLVKFDVPSRLLDDLEAGLVDVALCPVIDVQRSRQELEVVPAGGIGCDGTTLTVRLFSQSPLEQIDRVYADTDSHTSIVLLQIILAKRFGLRPPLIDYHAREHVAEHRPIDWPPAVLLIGDKVVTDSPPAVRYPHQLDLGHAWRELTGLPFVFAVWLARRGADLGDLPRTLDETRRRNATRIDAIVAQHAEAHGWPADLAQQYLGRWLRYEIGPKQVEAMRRFFELAGELGLIDRLRPLHVRSVGSRVG